MDELVARLGKDEVVVVLATDEPGLSAVHATHLSLLASFLVKQVEHSHLPLLRPANEALKLGAVVAGAAGFGALSGLGVEQQAHWFLSASFLLKQAEHSHLDAFLLANSAERLFAGVSAGAGAGAVSTGFFSASLVGLGALQQAHLSSLSELETKHPLHDHLDSPLDAAPKS